jgi:hypothetical protein
VAQTTLLWGGGGLLGNDGGELHSNPQEGQARGVGSPQPCPWFISLCQFLLLPFKAQEWTFALVTTM